MRLSTKAYKGSGSSRTLLRSGYVVYASDMLDPSASWYDSNRNVSSQRTVFNDDDGRYADVRSSDPDGVGHYTSTFTGGNFPGTTTARPALPTTPASTRRGPGAPTTRGS